MHQFGPRHGHHSLQPAASLHAHGHTRWMKRGRTKRSVKAGRDVGRACTWALSRVWMQRKQTKPDFNAHDNYACDDVKTWQPRSGSGMERSRVLKRQKQVWYTRRRGKFVITCSHRGTDGPPGLMELCPSQSQNGSEREAKRGGNGERARRVRSPMPPRCRATPAVPWGHAEFQ